MRTIRVLIEIIGLAVILVAGYWVWYANWGPNPNDRIASTVAGYLPPGFKDWGCGKLNQRFGVEAPTVCSPVAGVLPQAPAAPAAPSDQNGGRL